MLLAAKNHVQVYHIKGGVFRLNDQHVILPPFGGPGEGYGERDIFHQSVLRKVARSTLQFENVKSQCQLHRMPDNVPEKKSFSIAKQPTETSHVGATDSIRGLTSQGAGAAILAELLDGVDDPFLEWGIRAPSGGVDSGDIEQLARGPIGFGGITLDFRL